MRLIQHKVICFVLAFLVLVLSIGYVNVDEHFARTPAKTASACIFSVDHINTDVQFCTTEMMGIRNEAEIEQLSNSSDNQNRGANLCSDFLHENLSPVNKRNNWISADLQLSVFQCRKQSLIEYIHELDGKKRI